MGSFAGLLFGVILILSTSDTGDLMEELPKLRLPLSEKPNKFHFAGKENDTGLTQASHLSKKQLTISMKIHTQKEVKDFFSGAGNSYMSQRGVWKPLELIPSGDRFQIFCF